MNKKRLFYYNIIFTCNNNCLFCCSHNTREHSSLSVDIPLLEQIDNKYQYTSEDTFIITGGEPTIANSFQEIVSYLSQKTKHIILYSNGRNLRRYSIAFLQNFERIIIPIYGNEIQHNNYVGSSNAFEETIDSIRLINSFNPNLLELKFVIDSKLNLDAILHMKELRELLRTSHISVDKLITDKKYETMDDELISSIECFIMELHQQGKTVKFYDWPFCRFSKELQKKIEQCYKKELNVIFDIICCPINHKPFIIGFNDSPTFFPQCANCEKQIFCSQIMKRYYCLVWKKDQCWIGTE